MKTILKLLLCFLWPSTPIFSQGTVPTLAKKVQQCYLSLGAGATFSNVDNFASLGQAFPIAATGTLNNNLVLKLGYLPAQFYTKHYEATLPSRINIPVIRILDSAPYHSLQTLYVTAGKRKVVAKSLQLQAMGGFSYTRFNEVVEYISNGPEIFYYLTRNELHHKPGAIIQAEAKIQATRFAGLSLGGYYHYVPGISNGGLTLSLNLGLLRRNE